MNKMCTDYKSIQIVQNRTAQMTSNLPAPARYNTAIIYSIIAGGCVGDVSENGKIKKNTDSKFFGKYERQIEQKNKT